MILTGKQRAEHSFAGQIHNTQEVCVNQPNCEEDLWFKYYIVIQMGLAKIKFFANPGLEPQTSYYPSRGAINWAIQAKLTYENNLLQLEKQLDFCSIKGENAFLNALMANFVDISENTDHRWWSEKDDCRYPPTWPQNGWKVIKATSHISYQ